MKRYLAVIVALACVTTACGAAPDPNPIISEIMSRYVWLPQNEVPAVSEDPIESGALLVIYRQSRIQLRIDEKRNLQSAIWSEVDANNAEHDEEFMWNLRPDMPRDRMHTVMDGWYSLLRSDGIWDIGVRMIMLYRPDGSLQGFTAVNNPTTEPLPSMNLTVTDARKLSNDVAATYVYEDGRGGTVIWPYSYEQNPDWSRPTICRDTMDIPYVAYDFTYRLGDQPDLVFDDAHEDETLHLPVLHIRVNATTGNIVYVKCTFYKSYKAQQGLETNKPVSKYPAVLVSMNAKEAKLGFPVILDRKLTYLALPTIQALAKGHTVTAKADAKAFKLDGKELTLPAKVLSRKGVLYLPWQSLNSLPGVKAQYDAKLAKLDITTASVTAAK